MICLGYDYGTTNSLIARYGDQGAGDIVLLGRKPSSWADNGELVRSPKRLLSSPSFDGNLIKGYIRDYTASFMRSSVLLSSDDPVCLTVTIPNAFTDVQCKIVLDAVREAGCSSLGENRFPSGSVAILPEPVAAALHYVHLKASDEPSEGVVVVCDIGGGTTDLAAVHYRVTENGGSRDISFQVICTEGDPLFGGDDIDRILIDYWKNIYGPSRYLPMAARALKRKLSFVRCDEVAEVALTADDGESPFLDDDGKPVVLRMTRSRFGTLIHEKLDRLLEMSKSLKAEYARLAPSLGLDGRLSGCVILPVGGSSQIPAIRAALRKEFKGRLFLLPGETVSSDGLTPFDSVVKGAAVYSAWRCGELDGIGSISIEGRTLHRISIMVNENELETIVARNMPSKVYRPDRNLFPKRLDGDGSTFHLERIDLYEGEGAYVGDTSFGSPPVYLPLLEDLQDPIYTHGRELEQIPIVIDLTIKEGRLYSLRIHVSQGGRKDAQDAVPPDYEKEIVFVV